jgi:hypothetical protein
MFYIVDTTRVREGRSLISTYNHTRDLIAHLEDVAKRMSGKTRAEIMYDASDYGYGEDDVHGKTFYDYMSTNVEMGIVRADGRRVRCNIFQSEEYDNKTEFGQ